MIEAALGITAACLPRMRSLCDKDVGFNKLYQDVRRRLSIAASAISPTGRSKSSSTSSGESWKSADSLEKLASPAVLSQGASKNRGQSMASCDGGPDKHIADLQQPQDSVMVVKGFSVRSSLS